MNDKIIQNKIEKSLEIICPLYRANLIIEAYIIGSVAKGTARKESDIDIIIVNPDFLMGVADLHPLPIVLPYTSSEEVDKRELIRLNIANILKNIGVEFKEIEKKDFPLWHQLYKGELFHLIPQKIFIDNLPHIKITKDLCE